MKVLIVSTTVMTLPPEGYAGTEMIVYLLARGLSAAGCQVAVAAPEGSQLPDSVELVPTGLNEGEEAAYHKYKDRLEEFDVIHDHSFESWGYLSSRAVDPPLPIVKTFHTDPSIWGSAPPVPWPRLVGLSHHHSRRLGIHLGVTCKVAWNGVDTSFYRPLDFIPNVNPQPPARNQRLLHIGRYTPEKGVLDAINLCNELKIPLDCYGDTQWVVDPVYVDRCRQACDGVITRWFNGVAREQTVQLYQTYKGLLLTPLWDEPYGLVAAEANACGLPVVTIQRGGLPEIVEHEKTGYVCSDLEEVKKVLQDGCIASIDPEACRARVLEHFSVQKMVDRYLRLYHQVLEGVRW